MVDFTLDTANSLTIPVKVLDQHGAPMAFPAGLALSFTDETSPPTGTVVFDTTDPTAPKMVFTGTRRTVDDRITVSSGTLTPALLHVAGTNNLPVATTIVLDMASAILTPLPNPPVD